MNTPSQRPALTKSFYEHILIRIKIQKKVQRKEGNFWFSFDYSTISLSHQIAVKIGSGSGSSWHGASSDASLSLLSNQASRMASSGGVKYSWNLYWPGDVRHINAHDGNMDQRPALFDILKVSYR